MELKTINDQIGIKLRRLRMKRGLSMQIAYDIRTQFDVKIDPSYLSRIERGKVEIPLRTLLALAEFYDVSPGWMLDTDENSSGMEVPPGIEYIFAGPALVEGLKNLRDKFGEEKAKDYLHNLLEHILSLLTDAKNNEHENKQIPSPLGSNPEETAIVPGPYEKPGEKGGFVGTAMA